MLPFRQVPDQDIQERNKEEENQVRAGKPVTQFGHGNQYVNDSRGCDLFVSGQPEDRCDRNPVEHEFTEELQEFPECDALIAHKVPAEQYEAVDAGFPPSAPQQQVQ